MKQAIVILLPENKKIRRVRKKYEPYYKKFKLHISLVYPFQNVPKKQLYEHIRKSLKKIKPFKLTLKGLKKSAKEYYLYLLVNKGKSELKEAYKNLHSKLLTKSKNKNMPKYIPHITLGVFKTKKDIDNAIKKIKNQNLILKTKVNEISLLILDKNDKIKSIKKFKLK